MRLLGQSCKVCMWSVCLTTLKTDATDGCVRRREEGGSCWTDDCWSSSEVKRLFILSLANNASFLPSDRKLAGTWISSHCKTLPTTVVVRAKGAFSLRSTSHHGLIRNTHLQFCTPVGLHFLTLESPLPSLLHSHPLLQDLVNDVVVVVPLSSSGGGDLICASWCGSWAGGGRVACLHSSILLKGDPSLLRPGIV